MEPCRLGTNQAARAEQGQIHKSTLKQKILKFSSCHRRWKSYGKLVFLIELEDKEEREKPLM